MPKWVDLMVDKLEDAFAQTALLLFGKAISPMSKYSNWLGQRVPGGKNVKSCFGKGIAYLPDYGFFKKMPHDRLVSFEDLPIAAGKTIKMPQNGLSLANIAGQLNDFAYLVPTYAEGRNLNVQNTFGYIDCMNIRDSFDPFTSTNCSHSFSILDSEALFGVHRIVKSAFSIHVYNALNVQRCFEIDGAKNCADSYFCHNVEDLSNCMFCFNTKAKRYAIGNAEVGKEKYLEFRKKFSDYWVKQLESKGKLDFDIYNILGH